VLNSEKPREIACRALLRREATHQFVEDLVEQALARASLRPVDRRLVQELAYGVARWQRTLDWLIDRKTDHRSQSRAVQTLLRLGLYQLFWLDRVPDHAVVSETVQAAKQHASAREAGFVNAILRAYTRERTQTTDLLSQLKSENPAVGTSHPDWIVKRWALRYGVEASGRLLDWNNTPARVFARINTLRAPREVTLQQWHSEGITSHSFSAPWLQEAGVFELESISGLTQLESFQKGLFYLQDPSTLAAVQLLEPTPGDQVLDRCAAPGGKTAYMAQFLENKGRILAQDTHRRRITQLEENLERLGITCVETQHLPEKTSAPDEQFDRILLDAPCSNTGVMRRRIDLRWRITNEELQRLQEVQLELLTESAPRLKPHGTLVYSTCSLEPEENQEVVRGFLERNPGFTCDGETTLDPMNHGVDGCYAARIRRTG
jgi:16S rRNA (cytosine967-C5)-methyltransferase